MKLLPKRQPKQESMTVIEHLEELRGRLMYSLIAIGVGAVIGWFLFEPVLELLRGPFCVALKSVPVSARPPTGCQLVFTGPIEPFLIKLKIVGFTGLIIALPVVLWQFWRFINPGLTRRERRMGIPFVICSVLLFLFGAAIAYFTLPKGLGFLLGFAGAGFVPLLSASRYISFFILVMVAFGISFEFPIALIFLSLVGVLSSKKLLEHWRFAILFIAIFAAVITPSQDPYTMLGMMLPMIIFYYLAILVIKLLKR
jgi:sec-independent protein translocase protein TatC